VTSEKPLKLRGEGGGVLSLAEREALPFLRELPFPGRSLGMMRITVRRL
jgi:hypothetical protein